MNRLTSLEIKQLGKVENLKLDSLSPRLNIIFGRNESGKSTLRNSIRFALYGFPSKLKTNQTPDRYNNSYFSSTYPHRSVSGSITDGTQQYSFVQNDTKGAKTNSPSFSEKAGLELLEHMLSEIDSQEYRTVFNVTAEEMASIDQAAPDSYVSRFLASTFGTDKNPSDVRTSLEKTLSIHGSTAQGKKISLAKEAKAYSAAHTALSKARLKADEAGDARARQVELEQELSTFSAERAQLITIIGETEELLRKTKGHSELIEKLDLSIKALYIQTEQQLQEREAIPYSDAMAIKSLSSDIIALSEDASRISEHKKTLLVTQSVIEEAEQKRTRLGELPTFDNKHDLETLKKQSRQLSENISTARAKLSAAEDQAAQIPLESNKGISRLAFALFIAGFGSLVAGVFFLANNTLLIPGFATLAASIGFLFGGLTVLKSNNKSPSAEQNTTPFITQGKLRLEEAKLAWVDFTRINFPNSGQLNPLELAGLFEKLDESFELNTRILDLKNTEASLKSEVIQHSEKYAELEQKLISNSLFNGNNLRDTLDTANTIQQEFIRLDREISLKRNELESLEAQREEAQRELLNIEPSEKLAEELEMMRQKQNLIGQNITQLTDELGGIKQTIKSIGADRTVEQARAELEAVKTSVIEAARDLVKQHIALEILTSSMKEYSSSEAPNIMELSSRIFNRITHEEYASITLDSQEGIKVKDRAARTLQPHELSSGTADQLYLSIRLGMLLSLKERGKDLPVVLDDILSSFDEKRRTLAIREIVSLSKERQVILTTHDEQIFNEVIAQAEEFQTYRL